MKLRNRNLSINCIFGAMLLFLIGCNKIDGLKGDEPDKGLSKNDYHDYSTDSYVSLEINYGLNDYSVLFELYDEFPYEQSGETEWVKKNIIPLYRASTNEKGEYSGKALIPAYVKEVWLSSDNLGTIAPVKIEITGNMIRFDQQEFIRSLNMKAKSTSGAKSQHTYLKGFMILGDWNDLGYPDYIHSELADPPASTLYDIVNTYRKAADYSILNNHPEYFAESVSSDIAITKPTKVSLVFLNSTATWDNTVGYYTYPTGQSPKSDSEIQKIIAFPNASPLYLRGKRKGELLFGNQVDLKYWDGTKFNDEFPAGVSIGWFLQGMGFNQGNIVAGRGTRYSTKALNSDGKQRVVSLRDSKTDQIVSIGFEDNIDFDYCDATFYLSIEEKGAIDSGTLPELPDNGKPTVDDNKTVYYGTLIFEDLWPAEGDYDMNDIIIDYTSTVYKTIVGNKIVKIIDEFLPRHSGGSFRNGFGYQFDGLIKSDIRSIKIDGPNISEYLEADNMEAGQSHPTIILFDNINPILNKKYTVTITLNDIDESMIRPPYNPFIIANANRSREIHLINYQPTDKANTADFGTVGDFSVPQSGIYYISKNMMPFAIHLSRINDFPVPHEGTRINISYPYFESWVNSMGKQHADWYKRPAKK